ncbi:MAG: hypothetical protein ACOY3L_11725 [Pseudomonadota bacterium]
MSTLLDKSGYRLCPLNPQEEINVAIEEMILAVVTKAMSFDKAVEWFRVRIRKA